jgi:hypothetical protein
MSRGEGSSQRQFPHETLRALLDVHSIRITLESSGLGRRYWKGLGERDGHRLFLKATNREELRTALLREVALSKEIVAAHVPATVPILAIEERGLAVIATPFEEGAHWNSSGEERSPHLGERDAIAVADTLLRLSELHLEQIPSAPCREAAGEKLPEIFVRMAEGPLESTPVLEQRMPPLEQYLSGIEGKSVKAAVGSLGSLLHPVQVCTPVFLHGDASPSNTSFRADGMAAFFDWEWARFEGDRSFWTAVDLMNYVTRSWANLGFARCLLGEFLPRTGVRDDTAVSLRCALAIQCLNKMGPSYLYPEPRWVFSQRRFNVLRQMLRVALWGDDRDLHELRLE